MWMTRTETPSGDLVLISVTVLSLPSQKAGFYPPFQAQRARDTHRVSSS